MNKHATLFNLLVVVALLVSAVPFPVMAATSPAAPEPQALPNIEVEPQLSAQLAADGTTGYLIYFQERSDLSAASQMSWQDKGWFVMNELQAVAKSSQARVQAYLTSQKAEFKSFWIDNIISVQKSNLNTFNGLMAFPEIKALRAHRTMGLIEPTQELAQTFAPFTVEPNIAHVGAPGAWALGINGAGSVVASIDTGVRYTHQALVGHYRGNLGGGVFDHNYNWWDPYGDHPTSPADDNGHGSHTMGTMIGDDGGVNQIGMAPGAKWLACRGCNTSSCTDTSLLECAQFMAAPWDLNQANPNPDKRPNAVNNSWGDCGTSYDNWYQGVVDSWLAAGVYPVFSNGNSSNCGYSSPPPCNTVGNPGRYGNVTGVGSTGQSNGAYASHSNRGPSDNLDTLNPNGYPSIKPQVAAPGVNIRSSVNTSDTSYEGGWSGTSMSAPHVTGLVALLWQAAPCLVGDYVATENIIEQTATPITTGLPGACSGEGPGQYPNQSTGWGEINALAAVQAAMGTCGNSKLTGRVTQAGPLEAPGDPVPDAMVAAANITGTHNTVANAQGYYTITLDSGTYTVTAAAYGYEPMVIPNVVVSGTTVQNVSIALADWFSISGIVADATTGWPLYAHIVVAGDPVDPPAPYNDFWTDPVTGYYSVTLAEGITYTFDVAAFVPGYLPANVVVPPLTADVTQDFDLDADTVACSAPGYGLVGGFTENFDSLTPPALGSWATVVVTATGSPVWATRVGTRYPSGQPAHSAPNLVFFNSYSVSAGGAARLYRTSGIDMTGFTTYTLKFWMYHDTGYTTSNDRVQVQVSTNGGTTWENVGAPVSRYNGTTGWAQHTIDLSAYSAQTDLRLGFLGISAYGNDTHIDDIAIGDAPVCTAPADGGLVVGNVYALNTGAPLTGATVKNDTNHTATAMTTPDPAVDNAFYTIFSPAGGHFFTATLSGSSFGADVANITVVPSDTVEHNFNLPSPELQVTPAALSADVLLGSSTTKPLTITNVGGAPLTFKLTEKEGGYTPALSVAAGKASPTAGEDVLVVAYDTTAAASMETALTASGYTYLQVDRTTFQGMAIADLLTYKAVFYAGGYSGDSWAKAMAYLDNGGSFYISDNDLGYGNGSTTFYQTYLQATYIADDGGDLLTGEDIMAGLNLDVSADPYPDDFSVGAQGVRIFHWATANAGGDKVYRNGYKAIYTSFDFQNISTAADRTALVGRIMDELRADVPWLSEAPITGTVPALTDQLVTVTFDASVPEVTQPGIYTATLIVKSNDPADPNHPVPVTMNVTPPATYGLLTGVVSSTGYCDVNIHPLEGATVFIEGSGGYTYTLLTGADGSYTWWLDSVQNPYTVTVSAPDHPTTVVSVNIPAGGTLAQDFTLRLQKPCVSAAPTQMSATLAMGANDTQSLVLTNTGAISTPFELVEVDRGFQPALMVGGEHGATAPAVTAAGNPALAETGLAGGEPVLGKPANPDAAQTWDPWETMAPLPAGRVFNAVVASGNYVYVFGGTSDAAGTVKTNTSYRYNTGTNTWDTVANMPAAAAQIDGIAIGGKVYIPGDDGAADTYVYDIASDTWSTIPANGGYTARVQYQVTAIGTDLYVLGGIAGSASTTEVWVLDTTTGTWSAGVPMQKSRTSFSAAAIDGNLYVAGGVLFPGFVPDMTSEKFDGTAWSYVAPVPNGGGAYTRWSYNADGHGADGLWLAGGRRDLDWNVLNHAGYYNPGTDTWTDSPTIPMLAQARVYMEGDVADDGYFYVIGGRDGAGATIYTTNERLLVGAPAGGGAVPWLSEIPVTGTLAADGGLASIAVTLDAAVVTQPGQYFATLNVVSDDPVHGTYGIPVTMTVTPPSNYGKLTGLVTGLAHCDAPGAPLADSMIFIENSGGLTWTTTSNTGGLYTLWLPEGAYTVTAANEAGYQAQTVSGIAITGLATTTLNFDLRPYLPCASESPSTLDETVLWGGSTTVPLVLSNLGASDYTFEISEMTGTLPLVSLTIAKPVPSVTPRTGKSPFSASGIASRPGSAIAHSAPQADVSLVLDDGSSENALGLTAGGQFIWLNRFTPAPAEFPFTLNQVSVFFGTTGGVNIGETVDIYIYEDTDGDGDPGTGATFLGAQHGATVQVLGDWSVYNLDTPVVLAGPGDVLIAVVNRTAGIAVGTYPADFDTDASQGRSWVGIYNAGNPGDPPTLPADNLWTTIDDISYPGNWMVRGYGQTGGGGGGTGDVPWLSENPVTGTVPADGVRAVDITFTAFPTLTEPVYTATLVIKTSDTGAGTGGTFYVPVTMTISRAPMCQFGTNEPVNLGDTMVFTNTTMGDPPMSFEWNFGDGSGSTLISPTHDYALSGIYTVTLVATNTLGTGECSQAVHVYGAPKVGFTSNSPIHLGNVAYFVNTTTGYPAVSSWLWSFTNAAPSSSNQKDPGPVIFTQAGVQTVALLASSAGGGDNYTAPFVVCTVTPTVSFEHTDAMVGQVVTFTAVLTPATIIPAPTVTWSFGGTGLQATHVFTPAGDYTVVMTVTNDCDTVVYSTVVTVGEPVSPFHYIYLPLIAKNH